MRTGRLERPQGGVPSERRDERGACSTLEETCAERWLAAVLSSIVAVGAIVVPTAAAHPGPAIPVALGMGANLSTSGDYATDVLGDPWDFSNAEDVNTAPGVGCESAPTPAQFPGIDCSVTIAGGQLVYSGAPGSMLWLVRSWGLELPWGRDGENTPINAATYPVLSLSNCPASPVSRSSSPTTPARRASSRSTTARVSRTRTCASSARQLDRPIVSLGIYFAAAVRRRSTGSACAGPTLPPGHPAASRSPRVLTPNADGGADYATDNGNPFDMGDGGDVARPPRHRRGDVRHDELTARSSATTLRRAAPAHAPVAGHLPPLQRRAVLRRDDELRRPSGGGMECGWCGSARRRVVRVAELSSPSPGCNHISIDLATDPAGRSTTRTPWPRSLARPADQPPAARPQRGPRPAHFSLGTCASPTTPRSPRPTLFSTRMRRRRWGHRRHLRDHSTGASSTASRCPAR